MHIGTRLDGSILARARLVCFSALVMVASLAQGQNESPNGKTGSVTSLIRQMDGTWSVKARMWPAADAQPIELPPATARRRLVADAFLEEVMEPQAGSKQDAFARIAYFSYNAMNRQYEYFSLDTRLPQMMTYAAPGANKVRDGRVELNGASFVAPEWGTRKNVPFMYRLTVQPVERDRQVVQLYLTEQGSQSKEFLAFEYVYSRQR